MSKLTDPRVHALRAQKTTQNIRDTELKGFGVRVLPSGKKRYFLHSQHDGQRIWKMIGDPNNMTVTEARQQAINVLTTLQSGQSDAEIMFDTIAADTFRRYRRQWKPSTLAVNQKYFRRYILPCFAGRLIADITSQDVRDWFTSLHATPVAADRSMPVLSIMMKEAEADGLRPEGSNPCRGIKRYQRQNRERFLSATELAHLGVALRRAGPSSAVAILWLLALTGCRSSEILTLRWTDYRDGHLFLRDSKTGPRMVWLSDPARKRLDKHPRTSSWIFPAVRISGPLTKTMLYSVWKRIRADADLKDVRIHDLRHSYASLAISSGETVLTVGKLLGHTHPETTLKYAHHAETDVEQAVIAMDAVLGKTQT